MFWYKVSEGEYSDYTEIIMGHDTKYSEEEFLGLIEKAKERAQVLRPDLYDGSRFPNHTTSAWEIERVFVQEFGFIVLPILHQYHKPS